MIAPGFRVQIAHGTPQAMGQATNASPPWDVFAARLVAEPARSAETMAEFAAMPKDRRDRLKASTWYVGGHSRDGKRSGDSFPTRSLLTLDIDETTPAFVGALLKGNGTEYVFHTTRTSTPAAPRLRLILPLAEPVPAEVHAKATLGLKARIEGRFPGTVVDGCSVDANRLLYSPTLCRDAPHVAAWQRGTFPDVSALVAAAPAPVAPEARKIGANGRPHVEGRGFGNWRGVMEELGARLEPSPRYKGEWTTLCVWHSETHPSLDVGPDGRMYCWSCRRGGTVLSYVMQVLGCDAREAGLYMRTVGGC